MGLQARGGAVPDWPNAPGHNASRPPRFRGRTRRATPPWPALGRAHREGVSKSTQIVLAARDPAWPVGGEPDRRRFFVPAVRLDVSRAGGRAAREAWACAKSLTQVADVRSKRQQDVAQRARDEHPTSQGCHSPSTRTWTLGVERDVVGGMRSACREPPTWPISRTDALPRPVGRRRQDALGRAPGCPPEATRRTGAPSLTGTLRPGRRPVCATASAQRVGDNSCLSTLNATARACSARATGPVRSIHPRRGSTSGAHLVATVPHVGRPGGARVHGPGNGTWSAGWGS